MNAAASVQSEVEEPAKESQAPVDSEVELESISEIVTEEASAADAPK